MDPASLANKSSSALVPTANASRYIQQLCKHWSHNLEVDFTPDEGTVIFPRSARGSDYPADATVTFTASERELVVRIDASSNSQLAALQTVVERHLDRFAFREAPLTFKWR
jgi:hypothetical protein